MGTYIVPNTYSVQYMSPYITYLPDYLNYNRSKQRDEPITIPSRYLKLAQITEGRGHRQAADCPKFTNLCRNDARVVGEHLLTPAHFSIVILSPYCEECAQQFCTL